MAKRGSGSKANVGRKKSDIPAARFAMKVQEPLLQTWKSVYGRGLAKKIRELLDIDMKSKTINV